MTLEARLHKLRSLALFAFVRPAHLMIEEVDASTGGGAPTHAGAGISDSYMHTARSIAFLHPLFRGQLGRLFFSKDLHVRSMRRRAAARSCGKSRTRAT